MVLSIEGVSIEGANTYLITQALLLMFSFFDWSVFSFCRNLAELKDFVTSMKEVASGKTAEKVVVEEKAAEVFTITLDVDNYKDTVKEGEYFSVEDG